MDLYGGIPGIALSLAYLGLITGNERYAAHARTALTTVHNLMDQRRSSIGRIGGFDGWGGLIYVLTHLGAIWNRADLIEEAVSLVDLLPPLIDQDDDFDVEAGAAGCIGALRALHACAPSDRLTAVAIQCGDHLLACSEPMPAGIGWRPHFGGTQPLAGFLHGGSGVAWALLELSAWTGFERFRAGAFAACSSRKQATGATCAST